MLQSSALYKITNFTPQNINNNKRDPKKTLDAPPFLSKGSRDENLQSARIEMVIDAAVNTLRPATPPFDALILAKLNGTTVFVTKLVGEGELHSLLFELVTLIARYQ